MQSHGLDNLLLAFPLAPVEPSYTDSSSSARRSQAAAEAAEAAGRAQGTALPAADGSRGAGWFPSLALRSHASIASAYKENWGPLAPQRSA